MSFARDDGAAAPAPHEDGTQAGTQSQDQPRREFVRHTVDVPLEVETLGDGARLREHGINIGHGGLAFLSSTCPRVGDMLRIRIPTVQPPFEADARVAWCRPEGGNHLVGVQFLDPAAAFRSRMVQQVCSIENYRREVERVEGRALTTQEAAAEWIAKYAGRFPDAETASEDDTT